MNYKITIHALGYEDYTTTVTAATLRDAKKQVGTAKVQWCKINDIGFASAKLAFSHVSKL